MMDEPQVTNYDPADLQPQRSMPSKKRKVAQAKKVADQSSVTLTREVVEAMADFTRDMVSWVGYLSADVPDKYKAAWDSGRRLESALRRLLDGEKGGA